MRRDGEIAKCVSIGDCYVDLKIDDICFFYVWKKNGKICYNTEHNFDIINEYIDPTTIMKQFDPTKPVQTKDGQDVTILGTNGRGNYPIYGYVGYGDQDINCWTKEGKYNYALMRQNIENKWDLVNLPTTKVVPLDAGDVKFGDLLKIDNNPGDWRGIVAINAKNTSHPVVAGQGSFSFIYLQKHCEISRDGGKTWEKCEKVVNE